LSTKNSKILHNALSDARAIYEADIESKLDDTVIGANILKILL